MVHKAQHRKKNMFNVNPANMWGALGFFRNEKQFLIH